MWTIMPRQSVGPLRLGQTPADYDDLLTGGFQIFKRFPDSEEIYAYDKDQVHLTVDSQNRIIHISVFRPREVRLGEIQLLNRALQQVTSELNGTNDFFEQVDVGLENAELGIVLVEVDGVIDGVEVSV